MSGQCKTDPVTGTAGVIWTAYVAAGSAAQLGVGAAALVSGDPVRAMLAATFEAIAAAIDGSSATAVVTNTSNFTAVQNTHHRVDSTGGSVTVTLPTSGNVGAVITIKKVVAANNVVVGATALIDGSATVTLVAQWAVLRVRWTGATWDVI